MSMAIICDQLSLGYGKTEVVKEMSFTLPEGAYLAIIGSNGSGKSTLVKGLIGLLSPLKGSIQLGDGHEKIGYLPQNDGIADHFPASVQEVVQSGALNQNRLFLSRKNRFDALANLEKVKMRDYATMPFRRLSGGQRRRVLIARALTAGQRILFLDEPTAGLDTQAEQDLYHLLAQLNRDRGMTMVTISHDLTAMRYVASHILLVDNGRQRFFGELASYEEYLAKGEMES